MESVTVGNVSDNGKVQLSGAWSPFLINITDFCVVITGVPREIALDLNGGDKVYLEAIINGIVGDWNYYINCKNTLILAYRKIGR